MLSLLLLQHSTRSRSYLRRSRRFVSFLEKIKTTCIITTWFRSCTMYIVHSNIDLILVITWYALPLHCLPHSFCPPRMKTFIDRDLPFQIVRTRQRRPQSAKKIQTQNLLANKNRGESTHKKWTRFWAIYICIYCRKCYCIYWILIDEIISTGIYCSGCYWILIVEIISTGIYCSGCYIEYWLLK